MKLTTEQIIVSWLRATIDTPFGAHWFEERLPQYGKLYGAMHNASTYSREFRKLREKNKLAGYGLKVTEVPKKGSKEKWFKVTRKDM